MPMRGKTISNSKISYQIRKKQSGPSDVLDTVHSKSELGKMTYNLIIKEVKNKK